MTLIHTGDAIVPAAQATVPLLDHGFLFGDSVYEVVRTANGTPFQLHEHLVRMRRSAAMIYFELPWSDEEIGARIAAVQAELEGDDFYFRIIATRGPGPITLLPDECHEPGLYIIGRELMRFPDTHYSEGCALALVPRLRNDPRALDPRAKTGNYLNNMLGLIEARRTGADDAVFLNADENLTEATTANLWIVEQDRLVTPPLGEGLLAGITRDWVFATLPDAGIPVAEGILDRARFAAADEVFLTGTVKGIMPVRSVDGRPVGAGRAGPVTRRAAELYARALASN
ncbi:MAG: aminotransferase class IV [Planctomycetota bacterium]